MSETVEVAQRPEAQAKKRRPSRAAMACVGVAVAYLGMLASHGNGWSPLIFMLFGFVAGPVLDSKFSSRATSFIARMGRRTIVLLFIAGISCGIAHATINADGHEKFVQVFGIEPPPGVTHLRAWNQWYDGPNVIIAFDADLARISAIVSQSNRQLERDTGWERTFGLNASSREYLFWNQISAPFFNQERLERRPLTSPMCWTVIVKSTNESVNVIWDPGTRQAFARWYKD